MKVLLTGATGFLGSHIAELLYSSGHKLILTKRSKSDLWRCTDLKEKVKWINTDLESYEDEFLMFSPEMIIHSAWDGVSFEERDSWEGQIKNLIYQQHLLDLAKKCGTKKIIGVGSQAEYGAYNGFVDENSVINPTSAYSAVKHSAQVIMKTFCEENDIKWYWFRLFSCFGEREGNNWLIPSTIKNMLFNQSMDLTLGEQQYSYLYIKDIANIFLAAVNKSPESGIYNIAADKPVAIRDILVTMKNYLNPSFTLNFGAIPYRKNQSMVNGAINSKVKEAFGPFQFSDLSEKLIQTIEYYKTIYDKR